MAPNILFLMADQFRADALGCIDPRTRTPHLDALAARGWLFTNAYANSAECIPSRISLATGLYPHQTGVMVNEPCALHPRFPNWIQAIERAGYATSLFGKTHLHPHSGDLREQAHLMQQYGLQVVDEIGGPRASAHLMSNMTALWEQHGFLERYRADFADRFATDPFVARPSVLPLDLYYDCYVGQAARNYFATAPLNRPWFCWISFGGPHEPWDAPEPYASMYDRDAVAPGLPKPPDFSARRGLLQRAYGNRGGAPQLSDDQVAAMRANYAGNVSLIDDQIGKIIETIRDRGELDNTVIIFTSDHGEMNGDHGLVYKGNFLEPAIKVPLIVTLPGQCHPARSSAFVELMDVGATLVDYAAGTIPSPSLAKSLRPLITGNTAQHRPFAVSEFSGHFCFIDEIVKVEFDREFNAVLAFDRADIAEQCDLSRDPSYAGYLATARAAIKSLYAQAPPLRATAPSVASLTGVT
jgi:choline-sulfatase